MAQFSFTRALYPAVQSMATSLRNDSDQSHSGSENPGPSKRIKTSKKPGTAVVARSSIMIWSFVQEVKGDLYKFLCTICG